ncbi:MAG: acyl carrier protein [Tissierellia bacterium]|nr:acyl carrier protein [Tissierellia bacterium]
MVLERLKTMISDQFGIDEDDIDMDTSFKDDLNADSLDLVELIMAIEDEFDLQVADEEVENIQTVGDAVNYISELINE